MTAPQHPRVTIQKGRSSRLRKGHPWLFSNEVEMTPQTKALPRGGLVSVIDAGGEALGIATFNPHSLIAARLLTADPAATIDAGFIANRLRRALSLRDSLFPAALLPTDSFRGGWSARPDRLTVMAMWSPFSSTRRGWISCATAFWKPCTPC